MKHELKTFEVPDPDEPLLAYEIAVLKKSEVSMVTKGKAFSRNSYVLNAGEATNSLVLYPEEIAAFEEILAWIKSQEAQLDSDAPGGA